MKQKLWGQGRKTFASSRTLCLLRLCFVLLTGVMENVLSLYPGQSWDTSILPVLSSYGEPFMDAVCRDSCDGHDVGRVRQEKSCYIGLACDPGLPTDCSRTTIVASCKLSLLLKRCFFGACSKPCNAKLCRKRPPTRVARRQRWTKHCCAKNHRYESFCETKP